MFIRFIKTFFFSLMLLSTQVIAVCSQYMGFATLNEAGKSGFIEIKLLDSSISSEVYDTWSVQACEGKKGKCSGSLSLSDGFLSNGVYIVVPTNFIPNNQIFDILLVDGSGKTIDYLSVDYTPQKDSSCSLVYDWDASVSNTHDYRRMPDGTGNWTNAGNGNSGGNTGGGPNEGGSGPYLTIADDSVPQGSTINFTVTLSAAVNSEVTFQYQTFDNTALAGVHYTLTTGTGTIFSNTLTTTVSVNTVNIGDDTTRDFNLFIYSPTNAGIQDHFANGEITALLLPIVDYRFDECSYTGADFEVLDQTGAYPATAFSSLNTDSDGQIERLANISDENHHIETSIAIPTNFSVSTWFKKPTSTLGSPYFVLGAMQTGGDLLYLDRDNNWGWGVYDGSNSVDGGYSFDTLDDNWHHLTLVYSSGQTQLYIDGDFKESLARAPSGTLKYIATSFDDVNSSNPQGFRAPLDEFLVYDKSLTASNVSTIYNNQLVKKNYDGTERPPVYCSSLVAEWRMDEIVWSGTDNDVFDELGNLPGLAFNDVKTDRISPALTGPIGTCGYGEFDGVGDYLQIDDDSALDLLTGLTVSAWIYPRSLPSGGSLKSIVSKDTNYEFHLNSQGEIFWWWGGGSFSTVGANILVNNWYHVAITYRSGEQFIYINGVDYGSRAYEGELPLNNKPLQIGQDQGISSRFFHGRIDEVKIYDGALNAAEVFAIYQETHPCDVYIDHFEIDTLDQIGITCQADNIIIKACADASCSTVNPDAVDVELSINNAPYKTVTVAGITGTTTSYPFISLGTASLSLDQTYDCTNTLGTTPCDVDFKGSGFIFSDIPMQISGKPSNIGFNDATLSLKAVETNTDTGVCQGAFPDNTDVEVDLSYSCNSGLCSNDLALTNNNNQYSLNTTLSPYILRFGNDSTAFFTINYPDAGRLILNAQKDVEVAENNGNKIIKNFSGSSDPFVERPFAFKLDFSSDGNSINAFSNDALGTVFKKAGQAFTMTATAVQWSDNQDNFPYDGKPDDFSVITGNLTALHFDNEKLSVNHQLPLQLPIGGVDGTLTTETDNTFGVSFPTSQVNNDYIFSEVGIIKIGANIAGGDFLGAGTPLAPLQGNIEGLVTNVGRFYPDHFVLEIDTDGELAAYCDNEVISVAMPFAYSGQMSSAILSTGGAIRYSLNPSFTISAMSVIPIIGAANITKNYTGDFMKLVESSVTRKTVVQGGNILFWPVEDGSIDGSQGTKLKLTSELKDVTTADLNESEGVVTYTYNNQDNFVYTHELNAEINLFTTDINLLINSVIDPDGVTALDADDAFDPTNSFNTVLTLQPSGVEVRFGRAYLENSYGPETSPLPQVLSVEYFNDGKYVLAENDICSLYNANKVSFGAINEVGLDITDINPKDGKFDDILDPIDGLTRQIILPAAGNGNQGRVEVIYTIYDWLKYDWAYDSEGVDGLYNDNPHAIATFGIFRGNDRIIYQREIQR